MVTIGHHRIGGNIDAKYGSQLFDALDDPAPTVFEVVALSQTAQERPPHTAGYAVIAGSVFKGNQCLPWLGHGSSVNGWQGMFTVTKPFGIVKFVDVPISSSHSLQARPP